MSKTVNEVFVAYSDNYDSEELEHRGVVLSYADLCRLAVHLKPASRVEIIRTLLAASEGWSYPVASVLY